MRELIGVTPLTNRRIARGEYILSLEKEGFAPTERTISGVVTATGNLRIAPPPIKIDHTLLPVSAAHAGMVFVPGGDYRLISWSRPTDRRVRLADFFIDKYEVSNREYKEFISGGGYVKRDLWKHPFMKDGQPLSWDEAMNLMVDRTGLPGRRSWSNQNFPDGKGEHPVTDVTWYEAEAYAAFRGKQLPTVFQWEKAARNGRLGPATRYISRRTSVPQSSWYTAAMTRIRAWTALEPLFKLLVEPKRLTLCDGGHVPTLDVLTGATSGWLNEQLGPVAR